MSTESFSFVVMGDAHVRAEDCSDSTTNEANKAVKAEILKQHEEHKFQWIVMCGDAMDRAKNGESVHFNKLW